jgi:hypothetical protein
MAARYWVSGGTGNTNSTTNWSTTSGGASGASVPTLVDDAIWDNLSGSGTVTINATLSVLSANFTGFTGTLAGSSTFQIYSGGITLGAGMTITHTGSLSAQASATWTSNGKTWTGSYSSSTVLTLTHADSWTFAGSWSQTATLTALGAVNINVGGNLSVNALGASSNVTFVMTGTGSWSINSDASQVDYTVAATGNYTITTVLSFTGTNKIFTLIPGGTLTAATGGISTSGSNTFDLLNTTFNTLTFTGTSNMTFNSPLTCTGTMILGSLGQALSLNGSTLYAAGDLIIGGTSSQVSGTTVIETTGNGTFSSTQTTGFFACSINFNNGANALIISGTIRYRTGTMTRLSGTITAAGSTLILTSTCTLNTAGIIWNNITVVSGTITNNSLLTATGSLIYSLGSTVSFLGTAGWTVATFDIQTSSNVSHILKAGVTYTITTNFISIATTNANKDTLRSDTPGVQAILTLNQGANQSVGFTNATDINSSLGQAIYVANGTLSNATNWNPLTATDMGGGGSLIFVN